MKKEGGERETRHWCREMETVEGICVGTLLFLKLNDE